MLEIKVADVRQHLRSLANIGSALFNITVDIYEKDDITLPKGWNITPRLSTAGITSFTPFKEPKPVTNLKPTPQPPRLHEVAHDCLDCHAMRNEFPELETENQADQLHMGLDSLGGQSHYQDRTGTTTPLILAIPEEKNASDDEEDIAARGPMEGFRPICRAPDMDIYSKLAVTATLQGQSEPKLVYPIHIWTHNFRRDQLWADAHYIYRLYHAKALFNIQRHTGYHATMCYSGDGLFAYDARLDKHSVIYPAVKGTGTTRIPSKYAQVLAYKLDLERTASIRVARHYREAVVHYPTRFTTRDDRAKFRFMSHKEICSLIQKKVPFHVYNDFVAYDLDKMAFDNKAPPPYWRNQGDGWSQVDYEPFPGAHSDPWMNGQEPKPKRFGPHLARWPVRTPQKWDCGCLADASQAQDEDPGMAWGYAISLKQPHARERRYVLATQEQIEQLEEQEGAKISFYFSMAEWSNECGNPLVYRSWMCSVPATRRLVHAKDAAAKTKKEDAKKKPTMSKQKQKPPEEKPSGEAAAEAGPQKPQEKAEPVTEATKAATADTAAEAPRRPEGRYKRGRRGKDRAQISAPSTTPATTPTTATSQDQRDGQPNATGGPQRQDLATRPRQAQKGPAEKEQVSRSSQTTNTYAQWRDAYGGQYRTPLPTRLPQGYEGRGGRQRTPPAAPRPNYAYRDDYRNLAYNPSRRDSRPPWTTPRPPGTRGPPNSWARGAMPRPQKYYYQ
jgi:hypothetical protein